MPPKTEAEYHNKHTDSERLKQVRVLVDYRPALKERTGVGEYVHELVRALLASLRAALAPSVELHVLDLTINDRGFAEQAVQVLERLLAAGPTRRETSAASA